MFTQLSGRLNTALRNLRGRGRLSEDHINAALREVRVALLEADVALDVAREFIARVKTRALGREVMKSLSPAQTVIAIVRDELINIMGESRAELNLTAQPPVVVLITGLQGAGKTTTAGKLAHWLIRRQRKKVLLAAADVYRPAAIEQLRVLASDTGAQFFHRDTQDAVAIATAAVTAARNSGMDVAIIDTAGRMHLDDAMMDEIKTVHAAVNPNETLFVVDATSGQAAVQSARAFHRAVAFSGVVLTKTDGDARGGAALSVRYATGKPIKFIGVGEGADALEPFHPERIAARILGMGDVLSLVEEVERETDGDKQKQLTAKIARGRGFDLADYREQLMQMEKLGGLGAMMQKLPMAQVPQKVRAQFDGGQLAGQPARHIALINSMTPGERKFPAVIRGARKKRIAAGAGLSVQEVNRLLKQFMQMQKMMKRMKKSGKGNFSGMPGV